MSADQILKLQEALLAGTIDKATYDQLVTDLRTHSGSVAQSQSAAMKASSPSQTATSNETTQSKDTSIYDMTFTSAPHRFNELTLSSFQIALIWVKVVVIELLCFPLRIVVGALWAGLVFLLSSLLGDTISTYVAIVLVPVVVVIALAFTIQEILSNVSFNKSKMLSRTWRRRVTKEFGEEWLTAYDIRMHTNLRHL